MTAGPTGTSESRTRMPAVLSTAYREMTATISTTPCSPPRRARRPARFQSVPAGDARTPAGAADADFEASILAALKHIEEGDFVEAAALAEQIPGDVGRRLSRVIGTLNQRLTQFQTSVSRAVEEGARPLIASSNLAAATQLSDDQTNQLAALSEKSCPRR